MTSSANENITKDKTLVEIPEGAHNLLLDTGSVRERVLSDLVKWFKQRAKDIKS